jgi:uncharacterized protein YegP (UPF0339 family)
MREAMLSPFEIDPAKSSQSLYFRLKRMNHSNLLTSNFYRVKEAAKDTIVSVQANAVKATQFLSVLGCRGHASFLRSARNGAVIGQSRIQASVAEREVDIPLVLSVATVPEFIDSARGYAAISLSTTSQR